VALEAAIPGRYNPHRIAQPGEHDYEAVVIVSHPAPPPELDDRLVVTGARAAAACARSAEVQQRTTLVLTETRAARLTSAQARRQRRASPAGRDLMQQSEHARLLARLESMPVIEQAKGIIMAQSRCGHAQAFDLLRRASQRSNVPIRELAAQIVAKTTQIPPRRARQTSYADQVA
jgi:hypothetical protein